MPMIELKDTSWEWWIKPKTPVLNGYAWLGGMASRGYVTVDVVGPDGSISRQLIHSFSVVGTGSTDDHSSAAILLETGKEPLTFCCGHSVSVDIYYRHGLVNADDAIPTFAAEQILTFPAGNFTTYPQVFTTGVDDVHLVCRIGANTGAHPERYYGYARSSDWAGTWDVSPVLWLDAETDTGVMYPSFGQDGSTLRFGVGLNPNFDFLNLYAGEIDLTTGDIRAVAGGPVLGNLQTGVGLPVPISDLTVVHSVPVGDRVWVWDVSNGAEHEIVWSEWTHADKSTGKYMYGVYTGGQWVVSEICSSGSPFANQFYFGSANFTNEGPGKVIVSRQDDDTGVWTIERWSTADHGTTWVRDSVVARDSTYPLVRPFHIEGHDTYSSGFLRITRYGDDVNDLNGYNDWQSSLILSTK